MSGLVELTRLQKRFLSQRCCSLCEQPLHRKSCGAIYEPCVRKDEDRFPIAPTFGEMRRLYRATVNVRALTPPAAKENG